MAQDPATDGRAFIEARAAWDVTLDGESLVKELEPRLLSLSLSETRGEKADELQITVHDHDGLAEPPPQGSRLRVSLGWQAGSEVTPGLVDKGEFLVDEVKWNGPPDVVTITARSADLKGSFRTRKNHIWKGETIGAIVSSIARDHELEARCHADLAGILIEAREQANKSDMAFLRDLARVHDAIATVKGGALIFAPIGATTTATGAQIPSLTISRTVCSSYSWGRASRDKAEKGASAQWTDTESAKRKTVEIGAEPRRRLKRIYGSEAEARAAASAEANRLDRASASLDLELALGDPRISPNNTITAEGFRAHVDAQKWLVDKVTHRMDRAGLKSSITLESAS